MGLPRRGPAQRREGVPARPRGRPPLSAHGLSGGLGARLRRGRADQGRFVAAPPAGGEPRADERSSPLRRSRASRVLLARDGFAARGRPLGPCGGGRGNRGHGAASRRGARGRGLQEQRRRQGRGLRLARELPHEPGGQLRRRRQVHDPILRHAPAPVRRRAGGARPGQRVPGIPDLPARRLRRERRRPGDDLQSADHKHARRAPRRLFAVPPAARHRRRRQPLRRVEPAEGRLDLRRFMADRD